MMSHHDTRSKKPKTKKKTTNLEVAQKKADKAKRQEKYYKKQAQHILSKYKATNPSELKDHGQAIYDKYNEFISQANSQRDQTEVHEQEVEAAALDVTILEVDEDNSSDENENVHNRRIEKIDEEKNDMTNSEIEETNYHTGRDGTDSGVIMCTGCTGIQFLSNKQLHDW